MSDGTSEAGVQLLQQVMAKTAAVIDGVRPEQRRAPTPCEDYDVATLTNHMVGWARAFAAGAAGSPSEGDPTAYVSDDPPTEFRQAADAAVTAFRSGALERTVQVSGMGLPGNAVLGMMLMEYAGHGTDLAKATRQPVPYTDAEAEAAIAAGQQMLTDDFRGEGKPFATAKPVAPEAPGPARLAAFLGRDPHWTSPNG